MCPKSIYFNSCYKVNDNNSILKLLWFLYVNEQGNEKQITMFLLLMPKCKHYIALYLQGVSLLNARISTSLEPYILGLSIINIT